MADAPRPHQPPPAAPAPAPSHQPPPPPAYAVQSQPGQQHQICPDDVDAAFAEQALSKVRAAVDALAEDAWMYDAPRHSDHGN